MAMNHTRVLKGATVLVVENAHAPRAADVVMLADPRVAVEACRSKVMPGHTSFYFPGSADTCWL
ncbi:MAG: hypothetical protein GY917_00685 [Planctomycetaceae bacterium]|nr:hypothetical protein [Planctomycetaceae bacterium]